MRIQCPSCRQKFTTPEEFMGKTVECGSCDHRFQVNEETVISEKARVYPGEREELPEFSSVAKEPAAFGGFQQAHYAEHVDMAQLDPLKPRSLLAILAGVCIFIITAVIFLLAGGQDGGMRDVDTPSRYILVVFSFLLSGFLIIYGMKKKRLLGFVFTFVVGAVLMPLPYFFPSNPMAESSSAFKGKAIAIEGGDSIVTSANDSSQDEYLLEVGYEPVKRALLAHSESEVIAVFMRGGSRIAKDKIAGNIYESSNKEDRGVLYERGNNSLFLMTEQTIDIEELAAICEKFGDVKLVSKELRLIDLLVSEVDMNQSKSPALFDSSHKDFYYTNLLALKSIEPSERLSAVCRLGTAAPIAHRDDIVKKLLVLLPESNTEHQLAIIKALKTWSQLGDGAESAVYLAAVKLYEADQIDKVTMEFLIERKVENSALMLIELWEKDPVGWGDLLTSLDEGAQDLLLPKLSQLEGISFLSACRILGEVGNGDALSIMNGILGEKNGQSEKTLKASIDEIKKRL